MLELRVLEDADRTRNKPGTVTYNSADKRPKVETAERLFEEQLIIVRTSQERGGHRSVTLLAIHDAGDARMHELRAKWDAAQSK
jgi:hypothetical protein